MDGRELGWWREEAMQAGVDRVDGEFDDCLALAREEYWECDGVDEDENEGGEADEKPDESVEREDGEGDGGVEVELMSDLGELTEAEVEPDGEAESKDGEWK